ncbi:MAG: DUF819 family protein [Oscillibacter sp.]|jgi:uncharacterized membrane protein|nr:DUF819 family protein [Oscillibacter sp.]
MTSLISSENTWVLWAILVGIAALSIFLEQKYKWANKVTGCVIALLATMILANLHVIPTNSATYDNVWGYVVPLAVPLLLFNCDIRKIGKETGKLLVVYLLSAVGTCCGAIVGAVCLGKYIPSLKAISAMYTGTYTGGSVNFAAMADAFHAPAELVSAGVVADNLLMALYFFVLIAIPSIGFFRKNYKHPILDELEKNTSADGNMVSSYWKAKPIALKDIAFDMAAAFIIVAVSKAIAGFFAALIPTSNTVGSIFNTMLGNQYLIITTLTMLLATFLPKLFGQAPGASEIGTFLIYIFFAVIGAPASIGDIIKNSPILFAFAAIIVFANMLITFLFGKIFKFNLEDMIIASNANIGGPTTSAAMAISKGWVNLVGPAMLVGTLGYVLGNYLGIIVANIVA